MSVRCPGSERKVGRSAAADFFRDVRRFVEPLRFEIHEILTKDDRAVIVGELASRSKSARPDRRRGCGFAEYRRDGLEISLQTLESKVA